MFIIRAQCAAIILFATLSVIEGLCLCLLLFFHCTCVSVCTFCTNGDNNNTNNNNNNNNKSPLQKLTLFFNIYAHRLCAGGQKIIIIIN